MKNTNAKAAKCSVPEKAESASAGKVNFGLKSFVSICAILVAVMIVVGILTYVIPAGRYEIGDDGHILPESFHYVDDAAPLPVWRWITSPIEAIAVGKGNVNTIQIIALLLILGGTFNVLDDTGGLVSIIRVIINKFYKHRYLSVWIITLIMMLLASLFGLQEELLVLFPIFLMFSSAMKWSSTTAISLVLIPSGVGFTVALFNPFTIGICSKLAGTSVLDGLWYRMIIFAVMYVAASLYLLHCVKNEEKLSENSPADLEKFKPSSAEEEKRDRLQAKMISGLFLCVLAVIVASVAVPPLARLGIGLVLMAASFIIGTFTVGTVLLGSFKKMIVSFGKGIVSISPSIVIILLAFAVKYIAERGDILHTIFFKFNGLLGSTSPYVAVLLIYALILIVEFFIPGSSSKAMLLIPLLTLAPIPGISKTIILLIFLFADGYTNVLYPTCGTLVIGLSLANVSYLEWFKKTIVFQLFLLALSVAFLFVGVAIGL